MSDLAPTMFLTTDLCGLARGKGFPTRDLADMLESGAGWIAANQIITPFGAIPANNPFGPRGDLRLKGVAATGVDVTLSRGSPLRFVLADIVDTDGEPWPLCPRHVLNNAVLAFTEATGLRVRAAFEHEFSLLNIPGPAQPAFSMAALRAAGRFGEQALVALHCAGLEPEQFIPEFGPHQFEITCRHADPLTTADRAVALREIVRAVAAALDLRASFAPKPRANSAGNGVHIHLSLVDAAGETVVTHNGALTPIAAAFSAGVVRHMPAICAFATPSAASYQRLKPQSWVGAYACFGFENREAALRCSRRPARAGQRPLSTLEYRPMDATANPYLALAAILHAGRLGVIERLEAPSDVRDDPHGLASGERARLGLKALPGSVGEGLERLRGDEALRGCFPALLLESLRCVKESEIEASLSVDPEELAALYSSVY